MPIISNLRFFLLLSLISLFLILGSVTRVLSPINDFFEFITVPIQYFSHRTSLAFSDTISTLTGSFSAKGRIRELESTLQEMTSLEARFSLLEEENKVLKEQLGVSSLLDKYRIISANTIGLVNDLTIDRGEKDQIRVGQVAVFKNNLVGVVTKTTSQTATIHTTKDPQSKFLAFTQTGAKGVVSGNFGTSLVLDKVLQKEDVKEGELVLTAGEQIGEGFYIPQGLILGKVSKVFKDPSQAFLKAEVEPVFTFEDLKIIFILKEK